ncbi:MAG TPA: AMP-binding protein, partial [Oceanobacillus sp.]|nr:AMP-binding protein [Oceanobacillus sp.]
MVTYAERPWLKKYDEGVPASLEPYPQVPLHQLLRDAAQKYPNNIALVTSAHLPLAGRVHASLNYTQLDQYSDALAAGLIDMGLKKGDRVAL